MLRLLGPLVDIIAIRLQRPQHNGQPLLNEFVLERINRHASIGPYLLMQPAVDPDQDTVFLGGFSGLVL